MLTFLFAFLVLIFIIPALAHLAVWSFADRPSRWNEANWSSAGILPPASAERDAVIYVMSARTGGLKGAFATHSWIVTKTSGAARYNRYDKVGWGSPIRRNGYDADARWYSNEPQIVGSVRGERAEALIPKVEAAIAAYPFGKRGDYGIWPGPNSNTFIAAVLRAVPELSVITPSTAVGRDFPENGNWFGRFAGGGWFANLGGYAGINIGADHGLELHFLGLVAGVNPLRGELKVPAFGTFQFTRSAEAARGRSL